MVDPYLGQINAVGFNFAPRGWSFCNGQLLPISQNTALFALLGTTFGGDGRTTFALPDLRGRSIVHVGSGAGLDHISWGQRGGRYETTLTTATMPSHSHIQKIQVNEEDGGTSDDPVNHFIGNSGSNAFNPAATADKFLASGNTANTGGGQPFNTRNPYLGVYVCIAMVGVFPSRS